VGILVRRRYQWERGLIESIDLFKHIKHIKTVGADFP